MGVNEVWQELFPAVTEASTGCPGSTLARLTGMDETPPGFDFTEYMAEPPG